MLRVVSVRNEGVATLWAFAANMLRQRAHAFSVEYLAHAFHNRVHFFNSGHSKCGGKPPTLVGREVSRLAFPKGRYSLPSVSILDIIRVNKV